MPMKIRDDLQATALAHLVVGGIFSIPATYVLVGSVRSDDFAARECGVVLGVIAMIFFLAALRFWITSFRHERSQTPLSDPEESQSSSTCGSGGRDV